MGKQIFLSALTLIAGVCIGILVMFVCFDSDVLAKPADPTPSSNFTAQASPSKEVIDAADLVPAHPAFDAEDNRLLLSAAFDTLTALQARDYQSLSSFVHPTEGVIFTPYSTVEPDVNLCFTPTQVLKLGQDTTQYVWGTIDGKGDPLELTAAAYFDRFVYNADYLQAPMIGIDQVIGSGNALENVSEALPDCRFVEFYFPGLVPEYEGFDWCGLKLVFSEYHGAYKLRAIIHSEWTI